MATEETTRIAKRIALAFDLYATGESLKREQIRRQHPELDPDAVEHRLLAWLTDRPCSPSGDVLGRRTTWPRLKSR
jgi:hypothetical protein